MSIRSLVLFSMLVAAVLFLACKVAANVHSDFNTEDACLKAAKEAGPKGFAASIKHGFWKCAKSIIQSSAPDPEYKNVFESEQRIINNELSSLKSTIESSLPMKTVSPAFQWAQSGNEVLLNVKFSHKIDAPATLNVVANNVNITSDRLLLQASDGRKMFQLEIEFYDAVDPGESTWSMASVGRMTFTIKKSSAYRWLSLTKGNKKLPQMHFWWEMQVYT
jgi:CS domain